MYDSSRKYKKEWENKFPLVKKASGVSGEAFCKLCISVLSPKLYILQKHEETEKHKTRVRSLPSTSSLQYFPPKVSNDEKKAELDIAIAICCHSSKKPDTTLDHRPLQLLVRGGKRCCKIWYSKPQFPS